MTTSGTPDLFLRCMCMCCFKCPGDGKVYYIFGKEAGKRIAESAGVPFLGGIPMSVARALFPKGKEPRYAFEVLIRLLPEASLTFTQDGISIKALDPTKTSILDLSFYAASLEDYVLEEEVKVGLIFTTLKDVIKRIGATEKLEVEVDKERNRFNLYVYPKRGKEAGLVRRFSFPIVSVIEEEIPELSLTFDASFEVDAGVFDDLLAMACIFERIAIEILPPLAQAAAVAALSPAMPEPIITKSYLRTSMPNLYTPLLLGRPATL